MLIVVDMVKIFLFFGGIILASIGLMFIILYLNLLSMGYSFLEFGKFIISRGECWILLVGIIMIIISLERWIRNELLLRYFNKSK